MERTKTKQLILIIKNTKLLFECVGATLSLMRGAKLVVCHGPMAGPDAPWCFNLTLAKVTKCSEKPLRTMRTSLLFKYINRWRKARGFMSQMTAYFFGTLFNYKKHV